MTAVEADVSEAGGAVVPPVRARSLARRLVVVGRITLALAVVVAVVYATVSQWSEVHDYLLSLAWQSVVLSLVMVLLGTVAATLGWRAALTHVGHRIPVRTASQIYLIGLMAKYLPGSVWAFVLQMELGKRANLPRSRPFLASLAATGISATVALVLGLFALPALLQMPTAVAVTILALTPVALVCAHPRVLTWLLGRLMALVRRPPLEQPLTWRAVGAIAGWAVLMWCCFGVHLWLLANAEATPGVSGVFRSVGAVALGLTAGMLVFIAPSGLGVREAIIVATLLPYVPSPGAALGMALASRMVFTIGDLIAAGGAALAGLFVARQASRN